MPKSQLTDPDNENDKGDHFHSHAAPRGLLRFYALLSIAKKPKRGYDLMDEIETKTEGTWRPGPGAVYPVLRKLVKDGYIAIRRKSENGPAQVLYEITPEGSRKMAEARRAMGTSSQRLRTMSSLFIDLMEPDDLVKFALSSFEIQGELVRIIVNSEKSGLGDADKLFLLRQYRLKLERELARTTHLLSQLEPGSGSKKAPARPR